MRCRYSFIGSLLLVLSQVGAITAAFTAGYYYDACLKQQPQRQQRAKRLVQLEASFQQKRPNPTSSSSSTFRIQKSKQQQAGDDTKIEKFSVSSSRGSEAMKRPTRMRKNNDKPNNKGYWESFKSVLYGTVDGVESISEKVLKVGSDEGPGVQGGYSSIEKSVLNSGSGSGGGSNRNASPGQRLMNEYRARSSSQQQSSSSSQSKSSSGKDSAFNAFKATVYGTVDAASQVFSTKSSSDTENDSRFRQSFKPLVQSTLSSSEIQTALPDLQSPNPITRKLAENKIQNWEDKERKRQRALEREQAARRFKESVYQLGDAVVWSAETLAAVPSKVSYAAAETTNIAKKVQKFSVETIPGKVDQVVTTVTSIPEQVKQKSEVVQKSVKTGVEKTQKAIEEVKSIPTKIETTVKETKQKVDAAVMAVDEAATKVRVFMGLEKPKPKPPKVPPPPPPTAGEIGWKIAGSVVTGVATGTAKLAWWAGKGAAVTAWNGVQGAYRNAAAGQGKEPQEQLSSSVQPDSRQTATTTFHASITNTNTSKTTKDDGATKSQKTPQDNAAPPSSSDDDVDTEVQEALRLAQSAIDFADKECVPLELDDNNEDNKKK